MSDKYFYPVEYHKNDVKMQEMPLERTELAEFPGGCHHTPLQARALASRVSALLYALKHIPYFPPIGVGMSELGAFSSLKCSGTVARKAHTRTKKKTQPKSEMQTKK